MTSSQGFLSHNASQANSSSHNEADPELKFFYRRKKKDSPNPKRPKSGYMLFSIDTRKQLRATNPNLISNQVMKEISMLWKSLDPDQKAEYEEMANQDKQRYQHEKAQLLENNPYGMPSNRTKNTHVKKPCSPYDMYVMEKKPQIKKENPDILMADVLKLLSSQWKALDANQKAVYKERAENDKIEKTAQLKVSMSKRVAEKSQPAFTLNEEEVSQGVKKKVRRNERKSTKIVESMQAPSINIDQMVEAEEYKTDMTLNRNSSSNYSEFDFLLNNTALDSTKPNSHIFTQEDNEFDPLIRTMVLGNTKQSSHIITQENHDVDSLIDYTNDIFPPLTSPTKRSDFHFGSLTRYSEGSKIGFLDMMKAELFKESGPVKAYVDLPENQTLSASDFLNSAKKDNKKKSKRPDLTAVYQASMLDDPFKDFKL